MFLSLSLIASSSARKVVPVTRASLAACAVTVAGALSAPATAIDLYTPSACLPAPAVLSDDPAALTPGKLAFLAGLELKGSGVGLGGVSGLDPFEHSTSRVELAAVTDDGHLLAVRLELDERQHAVDAACFHAPILGPNDKPLRGKRDSDAEGIAASPQGDHYIVFERRHRIERLHNGDGGMQEGPALAGLDRLRSNQALEAIAIFDDGLMLVGAETPNARLQPHPVWRLQPDPDAPSGYSDAGPAAFKLAGEVGYGLTGFAPTPAGNLMTLERFWTPATGARIKVGWISGADARTATGLVAPHTVARLDRESGHAVDNFEGLAATPADDGSVHVWMVSDNNFNPAQRTLIYQFAFDEAAFMRELGLEPATPDAPEASPEPN